ncbi:aldehyde dehydrogenase family protein [Pseudomonas abietaniphila]|uniref:aldehyde dehydrogenase family protein n=1 Tax=Pseudomonas abietaniphila TaxID=89065 RepID=UPI0007805273|nr:aldehyde dehydrogenase family protein [Pseudomonas abietaniphila]
MSQLRKTPANTKPLLPNTRFPLTIAGMSVHTERQGVINPATGEVFAEHSAGGRKELEAAVESARSAFPAWSQTSLAYRQSKITELAEMLTLHQEDFMRLLTLEQGKARAGAEWEIGGCIHWLQEIAKQSLPEKVIRDDAEGRVVTRHVPLGVVGAITPWNFPMLLALWKIAPALLAGNTLVVKPSPYTPLCTLWFGELAQAILPPGVLNVVAGGNEMGQWLTEHPQVDKISFTGSTATGRLVMKSAASNIKRVTLELGGNDPAIVLPDVDPHAIAKELFWAAFQNSAQFCVATKRLYIHDSIYDEVAQALSEYAAQVTLGNGLDPETKLGPLQNQMQYDKVCGLIESSRNAGLRFLAGGEVPRGKGYFIPITLIDNPPDDARCVVEEAFGPVLPLLRYHSIDEVVERANNTEYGLAASVWGRDLAQAQAVAQRIQAGTVWINQVHVFSPHIAFGGHKQSGLGIENALDGLSEYTNVQTVMSRPL